MKYDIPDDFKKFVAHVKRKCKANKIELVLSPSRNVVITDTFSTDCSGYFDDVDRTLVVACGKPFSDWIEILVHEYSHMEQWLTDDRWEYWGECCQKLWEWIDGDLMMNNAQLGKVLDGMIELERDCEIRSLNNIKKFGLKINKSSYARKANLYLYSYRIMPKLKKFPSGIYENKSIVNMCPSKIKKDYTQVPKEIYDEIVRIYS
jgi:hypothetical protein